MDLDIREPLGNMTDGSWPRLTPDHVRNIRAYAEEHRTATTPFDIVLEGVTPGDDPQQARSIIQPLAEAGATWWIESMWDVPGGMTAVRKRIKQGPPRIEWLPRIPSALWTDTAAKSQMSPAKDTGLSTGAPSTGLTGEAPFMGRCSSARRL